MSDKLTPNNPRSLKKFMINIVETTEHNCHGFLIYLSSENPQHLLDLNEKLTKGVHSQDLTAGEFYAHHLNSIVVNTLEQAGVVNKKIVIDKETAN